VLICAVVRLVLAMLFVVLAMFFVLDCYDLSQLALRHRVVVIRRRCKNERRERDGPPKVVLSENDAIYCTYHGEGHRASNRERLL